MRVALCRTEQRAFLREYVTTVTMMSSEGAKNACRVVPHRATGIFARICDDCHDDELRRSEECVSRCAARAGAEPQAPKPHKRRKPTCV